MSPAQIRTFFFAVDPTGEVTAQDAEELGPKVSGRDIDELRRRLLKLHGIPPSPRLTWTRLADGGVICTAEWGWGTPCPDCQGRGEYCGLMVVEICRACAGTGVQGAGR